MPTVPVGAILDAGADANAAPVEGPIATGGAALPAAVPVAPLPGVPAPLPDLPGGVPNVPGPASLQAPPSAPASVPGAVPLPPELQATADATAAHAAASEAEGAAKQEAGDAKAQAEADARVQHQLDAQEAADLRASHAAAAQEAEDRTQKALIAARDTKIPDFWAGREGSRVSAALMVGLGGAAAGLLGTSKNGAADIIQANVDDYYKREKQKIDNLYKYADAQGKAGDDLRMRQAAELAELQVQHGATNLAIADHIHEIEAASQGRIDHAAAHEIATKVLEEGQASLIAGQKAFAEIALKKQQGQLAAAKAAKAKGGGAGGGGAGQDGAVKLAQEIEAAKAAGKPMTYSEMAARARSKDINIPLDAKAGHVSLKSVIADSGTLAAQAFKATDEGNKQADEANKQAGTDPKNAYMENGKIVGYVPSGRGGAAAFGARVVKYNTAIRALTELEQRARNATGGSLPWGPEFHSAVLAIASTTQAGSTDKNVAHEEGTLKGTLGTVSADAISRKIEELKTQQNEFKSQLIPPSKVEGAGTAPQGKRLKLKDGRTGTLDAGGMFHQDP